MNDITAHIQSEIELARRERTPLSIAGSGSKHFYGRAVYAKPLHISAHRGIVNYEPTELVITARAGTPLRELEEVLSAHNQMLPFEPPHFGPQATLGGAIACGFAGPRRPFVGGARDFVLGTRLVNGRAEVLHFGGEVMKNVAGYDVSRLMAGALGTLGVLLEVSLKVLPRPESELTLTQHCTAAQALARVNEWMTQALPLSAACYHAGVLTLRLSGATPAVSACEKKIGGERLARGEEFWRALREHELPFFSSTHPLWRLSLPSTAQSLELEDACLLDWGGAQRWLCSDAPAGAIRERAAQLGGHATLFRAMGARDEVFPPLTPALFRVHQNLKRAFDPDGILNPGRLYAEL